MNKYKVSADVRDFEGDVVRKTGEYTEDCEAKAMMSFKEEHKVIVGNIVIEIEESV